LKTFTKIIPHLKQNFRKILFGLVLLIIVDIAQLIIPKIMQYAIDGIGTSGFTKTNLFYAGAAIFLIACFMTLLRFFWRLFLMGTAWSVDKNLRQEYFDHLISLSANFFNKVKTGGLMVYATNDLNAIRMLVAFGFVISVDIVLKKIHHRFGKVQKSFEELSAKVQESVSGIRVVKAFVQEDAELDKISDSAYDYVNENISLIRIQGMFYPSFLIIIGLSMTIVLVFGGEAAMVGEISIGEFIAFFQYLGMFVWPMIAIGWVVNLYQRGTASLKRLNGIFEEKPEIKDEAWVDHAISQLNGKIEFKDLSFQYNAKGPLIFKNISFDIEAGKTLAIVGRTGCGKSTLIDLLTRVYNPQKNSIFIDEHEIFKIPLKTLRENIIMVPQDIFLFSQTIKENITLAKPDASAEEIENVTKSAQVYDDIVDFREGFKTIVGERGITLSGGQKQRIAIARALLTDPKVLILDDALSAVDTKTEKLILENLIKLRKEKTTIIIAHRISSVQRSDKIIVLDKAQIAEEGTHKQLIKTDGLYKNIYEKQQLEEKISARENKDSGS